MPDTSTLPPAVAELDGLDDDAFRRIIEENVPTATGRRALWAAACHSRLVDRTAGCLEEIADDLQQAIRTRGLAPGHFKHKRLAEVRNRMRMVEARADRSADHQAHTDREADAYKRLVRRIGLAVNDHRLACIAANLAPEPHDLALWAALDDLRLPGAETSPTIAEQIASGRWHKGDVLAEAVA